MSACDREDDEDYQAEACADRFRKLNPDWTEEEIENYLCRSETE